MVKKYRHGSYPRFLWVAVGDCFEEIKRRFRLFDGVDWPDYLTDDKCDAWTLKVVDRRSLSIGYLVWMKDSTEDNTAVHEAGHVTLSIMDDISCGKDEQEPFCYLLQWVFESIRDAISTFERAFDKAMQDIDNHS